MKDKQAEKLFEKYRNGSLSDQERLQLNNWYLHHIKSAAPLTNAEIYKKQMKDMDAAFPFESIPSVEKVKWWPRISIAASILLAVSIGLYLFASKTREKSPEASIYAKDIKPGGNKAYLTLADGRRIALADASNGEIAKQAGIRITKAADGQIIYEMVENSRPATNQVSYNTIQTPIGGQYQVRLPDGSKVWLNAASSLEYPTSFESLTDRKVKLSGEAYFEVAKDVSKTFLVVTDKQTVAVLGTHFNINSYSNEPSTKTTLLEGSVKIITKKTIEILKPGQEAAAADNITIYDVNTDEAIAWKNGIFNFQGADIPSVMRELSRWYNVHVEFEGQVPNIKLWGEMDRNVNASEALEILKYFNLNYKILQTEDKIKIVIYKSPNMKV